MHLALCVWRMPLGRWDDEMQGKPMKINESRRWEHRKPMRINGNQWKSMKIHENQRKSMKINGNQ